MRNVLLVLALVSGSAFANPPGLSPADVAIVIGVPPPGPPSTASQLAAMQDAFDKGKQPAVLFELAMAHANNMRQATDSNARKDALLKAVKAFKTLVDGDGYRSFDKLDVALFHYGYVLQTGRYMKEARSVYQRLLVDHPASPYVGIAHAALAQYYADAGQLADAQARYEVVAKLPKSPAQAYALFQLGKWLPAANALADIASERSTPPERARVMALAAALAYRNALALPSEADALAKLAGKKAALSKTERQMLEVHAFYTTTVDASDANLGTMQLVEAAVLRSHGDHVSAIPVLVLYLRDHADAPDAEVAERMRRESSEFVRSRSPRK